IERSGDSVTVHYTHKGEAKTVTAAAGFNALGRTPQTEELFLSGALVDHESNGRIPTNFYQQTNQSHIYAAGDCTGPYEVVHLAVQQGETAARHFLKKPVDPMDYNYALMGVFTDPQIAYVGLTGDQLRAKGLPFLEASYPFNDHGKS